MGRQNGQEGWSPISGGGDTHESERTSLRLYEDDRWVAAGPGNGVRQHLLSVSKWTTLRPGAQHSLLDVIVILAFLLRLSGNLYDMPFGFHPDEKQYLHWVVMVMGEGTINPADFSNLPVFSKAVLLVLCDPRVASSQRRKHQWSSSSAKAESARAARDGHLTCSQQGAARQARRDS